MDRSSWLVRFSNLIDELGYPQSAVYAKLIVGKFAPDASLLQEDLLREKFTQLRQGITPNRVIGDVDFYNLTLSLAPEVFEPRSCTELLVDYALSLLDKSVEGDSCNIMDLGCGTGAIGLALAKHMARAKVVAHDINPAAVALSRHNAAVNHVSNYKCFLADWFTLIEGGINTGFYGGCRSFDEFNELSEFRDGAGYFDCILSNPPYIEDADGRVEQSVVINDPALSLFAGADGLDCYKAILDGSKSALLKDGLLMLEASPFIMADLQKLASSMGWKISNIVKDFDGFQRIIVLKMPH